MGSCKGGGVGDGSWLGQVCDTKGLDGERGNRWPLGPPDVRLAW